MTQRNNFEPLSDDIRFQSRILNTLPIGIGIYEVRDRNVQQVFLNDGFYSLMEDERKLRDFRKSGNFMSTIHPDDREKLSNDMIKVINGDDYLTLTCRVMTGSGTYRWIRMTSVAVKRENNYILVYSVYNSVEEEMENRQALEESQAILDMSIKAADMSVWEYDCINHCIIQKNNSVEKHGYGKIIPNVPDCLVDSGYVHKDSVNGFKRMFKELFEKQQVVHGDFYVQNGDRSGYWWENIILTPIFDDSGRMVKALGTSLDITERKIKEKQYYDQLGAMSENDDHNLIAKGQYNITRSKFEYYVAMREDGMDLKCEENFEDLLSKLLTVIVTEEKSIEARKIFNVEYLESEFDAGRYDGIFEYRRKFKDRPIVYALIKYLLAADPVTGDLMLFIYCLDNTSKKIEQLFIDNLCDQDLETFGVIDVSTGDYSQMHMKLMDTYDSFVTGHNYYNECMRIIDKYVISSEKEEMKTKLKINNILSKLEQEPVYMISYSVQVNGVIHRKKLIMKYTESSHDTILYTSSDITSLYAQEQDQLIKTQKALEAAQKATRAKSEFLSRMSHDIRTPLNAILGSTALAKADIGNPAAIANYIDNIDSAGHFLLGLVNNILDISKIESGKLMLHNDTCRFSEFKEEIERSIRPMMEIRNISFEIRMNCEYESICVDAVRYYQVFANLLSNAAKYTPMNGKVELIIENISTFEGVICIRNIVRDNGVGMSKEFMSHMFEPFTRDDDVEINKIEGSGLGLAIVKNIVDAMGGSITVNSELGLGTEFIVDIYVKADEKEENLVEETKQEDLSGLNGLKIMIVDDNDINIGIFKRLLELQGCSVIVAENGKAAVDCFKTSSQYGIDIILMDIRMPVMSGLDASRIIRSLNRKDSTQIPIIAMTADAFVDDVNKTRAAGMNEHLTKPVDPEKLYSIILKYCK